MKSLNLIVAMLALAITACNDGPSNVGVGSCSLGLAKSPDGTLMLEGDCHRNAESIAAAIAHSPGLLKSAGEIALGRTRLGPNGAFDHCAVMAHLAGDPRWTASIDSNKASAPLRDALQAVSLAPDISAALAKEGRKLRGVSLEKILLSDAPVRDCPVSPAKAPVEAQMWLLLQ